MEEFIKWIIENKALLIMASITIALSVSIPISIHFGKTIIHKNKTTNYYNINQQKHNSDTHKRSGNTVTKIANSNNVIELTKISLYSTGKKGKVYTTKFYKSMNHNFGVEIILKNNTFSTQYVKVGWCIYKDGIEVIKGSFNKKINPNAILTTDFYVKAKTFKNLKVGEYKSQFWVNDVKVQKVFFTILYK